ncbi:integrase [Rhodococcus sp. GG48]|nr:integrase [Rhodococcus sp. GG48]
MATFPCAASIGENVPVSNPPVDPALRDLSTDPYAQHIAARLLDFFSDTSTWQRRLWDTGTVLSLRELHEASEWRSKNVLSTGSISWLSKDIERLVGRDRGLGDKDLRMHLTKTLRTGITSGSRHHRMLQQITDLVNDGYITRWVGAIASSSPPSPERCSRAVASHLLDCGYSMRFLHRWVEGHIYAKSSLGDLLQSAEDLASGSDRKFEVIVPFASLPQAPELAYGLDEWRRPEEIRRWLADNAEGAPRVRQAGGFRYRVEAKDAYAASDLVAGTIDRLIARSSYTRRAGRGKHIPEPLGVVWVYDELESKSHEIRLQATQGRGAVVLSLSSERRVYDVARPTALDDALELAAPLNNGAPGPAISGGWAAVEALLVAPGDGEDSKEGRGAVAADRMAALVACSWPRAELTTLAYRHNPNPADRLAAELDQAPTNRERARLVADALVSGRKLVLEKHADIAAVQRMESLVNQPRSTLSDVSCHITTAMRRLYRQRNLLMHGGSTSSVALGATLRTAAPLVGAGLDRITHAALIDNTDPLPLASRALLNLSLVGGKDGRHLTDLLE